MKARRKGQITKFHDRVDAIMAMIAGKKGTTFLGGGYEDEFTFITKRVFCDHS